MPTKEDKYYDVINLYPRGKYPRNDGTITTLKTIRLTPEELINWNVKAVHKFLQGELTTPEALEVVKLQLEIEMLEAIIKVYKEKSK